MSLNETKVQSFSSPCELDLATMGCVSKNLTISNTKNWFEACYELHFAFHTLHRILSLMYGESPFFELWTIHKKVSVIKH